MNTKEYSAMLRLNGYIEHANRFDQLLNQAEEMQKTLTEIANFDVAENYGLRTERNEATSFITCRNLARQALKGE